MMDDGFRSVLAEHRICMQPLGLRVMSLLSLKLEYCVILLI